jgi:hypothetical protein
VLRIKSLFGCSHGPGYTPFNAGARIKVRSDGAHRGAAPAKRIISEVEVGLLIRAAPSKRDRVLLETLYTGRCGYPLPARTGARRAPHDAAFQAWLVPFPGRRPARP